MIGLTFSGLVFLRLLLAHYFAVLLPFGLASVGGSPDKSASKRIVHFKDGTFKEYPVGFRYDLPSLPVSGGDKRLDNFGERVIMGSSHGSEVFSPPVLDITDSFCQANGYRLVGHRPRLNEHCDEYVRTTACLHVENHTEHAGLIPTHKVRHHCYSYECADCYFWGACVREAGIIEGRLLALAEKFGKPVEAGMVSLPKSLYDASEEVKRLWSIRALKSRGIEGSNLICHPFSYESTYWVDGVCHMAKWSFAYHIHWIGFLKDDYVCRSCLHYNQWGSKSVKGEKRFGNHGGPDCLKCFRFEGLTRRLREKDGFIVKVFDKRESIFRTAAYELSHAGYRIGAKHVSVSSWFGSCKVKVDYVRRKMLCPEEACKSEFVPVFYSGDYEIVKSPKSPDFERDSWMSYLEDGKIVWNEIGVTYRE